MQNHVEHFEAHWTAGTAALPCRLSGLAKIVVGQQLSTHSAAAIWARVEQALSPVAAETIRSSDDASLKSLGLSNGKVRTLQALSRAVIDDGLDFGILNVADDRTIVERLTAVHGIGPWTADIYILFALARKDAFASGDLAYSSQFNITSNSTDGQPQKSLSVSPSDGVRRAQLRRGFCGPIMPSRAARFWPRDRNRSS